MFVYFVSDFVLPLQQNDLWQHYHPDCFLPLYLKAPEQDI